MCQMTSNDLFNILRKQIRALWVNAQLLDLTNAPIADMCFHRKSQIKAFLLIDLSTLIIMCEITLHLLHPKYKMYVSQNRAFLNALSVCPRR